MKAKNALRFVMAVLAAVFILLVLTKPLLRLAYPIAYVDPIFKYAAQFDADPLLVAAVVQVESRFDPRAESPKGARGLMQVMPDTATWAIEQMRRPDLSADRLYEPEVNLQIGVWYLTYLIALFDGQVPTALAAYNAGPGNVRRWLDGGVWSGQADTLDDVPYPETRGYVSRVLNLYGMYRWLYGDSLQASGSDGHSS